MSKSKPIEIFTLKALAAEEGISYAHMKRLMMDIAKCEPITWRGWHFQSIGPENRKNWLAYRGKAEDVILYNEPRTEIQKE